MSEIYITLTVAQTRATAAYSSPLTAKMVGVEVRANFDSAWDGLTTRLVAVAGDMVRPVTLSSDGIAELPWEVLIAGRYLRLGVTGLNEDGSIRIPTVWADVGKIHHSAQNALDESTDPAPSPREIDQVTLLAQSADARSAEAKETAEKALAAVSTVSGDVAAAAASAQAAAESAAEAETYANRAEQALGTKGWMELEESDGDLYLITSDYLDVDMFFDEEGSLIIDV